MKPASLLNIFFILTLVLFSFGTALAQIPTSIQGIDFVLSTNSPAPGQNITVTAESYMADLNGSTVSWSLNGKAYQKGIGLTSIQIQAPALGKKLTITVSAITADGKTLTNNITLSSGGVDLILETDGYVPPFFMGKIPLSFQNEYRVIAIPHLADASGKEYDPQTLVYQWTKDSKVIQDQSGYGRQVFSWKEEIVPRQRVISVKVFTRDNSASAEKIIVLEAKNPSLGFYIDDPLYGTLWNKAVTDSLGLGKSGEVSVLAVPFGFNKPESGLGDISFSWLLNAIRQDSLSQNRSITLRAPENSSGSSDIQLSVQNNEEILQKARSGFLVNFTNKPSSSSAVNTNGI